MKKVRWGILGAAKIARELVIPAMQKGRLSEVTALASRDADRARKTADQLGIPKSYGSYEELLADPDIDAVYNPLPNHLHVPLTIQAAEAGKHVLCEKPLAITSDEAQQLVEVRDRTGVKIQEAFMVSANPQWMKVRELVREGRIGKVRSVTGHFTYMNTDAANVRNKPDIGGGGILDIGCYLIFASRFFLEMEPEKVISKVQRDPNFGTDILASFMLDCPNDIQGIYTCGTQSILKQLLHIDGTSGRIEIEVPVSPPMDKPTRIFVDNGPGLTKEHQEEIWFEPFNHYTLQGDAFSEAILNNSPQLLSLESSIRTMNVIDAIFRSEKSGTWENIT